MIENKSSIELSRKSRIDIVKMTFHANASHSGSSLSSIDILSVLYFSIVDLEKIKTLDITRDVIIMSKGHAAAALYSVLVNTGLMDRELIGAYCDDGSLIGGHVTSSVPSIELSTGSLGHGFPYGVGIAISKKRNNHSGNVIIVMSDGECDEGTTWESALLASHFKLNNLIVIIDRNRLQSLRGTEETLALEPLLKKWESFGWDAHEIDGHDHLEIAQAVSRRGSNPKVLIANTVKGKGVSYMENTVLWHYKAPNEEELLLAIKEINES